MIRPVLMALVVALAACGAGSERAPAHPSQSQATKQGETRQINISEGNRTQVETNIRDQLGQAARQFAPGGVPVPGREDLVTTMQPGADHQFSVNLENAGNYVFVGVCDADCTNIDLEVLNGATGEVVGSDLLEDDFPVVTFTAPDSARYFVRLILRTCTQAPCYVGARVLQMNAAAPQ
jgi:hypothetical protein